jgi:predicted nucleotidyltransferase
MGHQYHIRKSRKFAQIDAVIAVISANFAQRGSPALIDKRARAEMALACGIDLVLELPCVFSSCNAGIFANAAVDILAATGVVDCISFGMEAPLEKKFLFESIARVLNDEPEDFKRSIKKHLAAGYSFVRSRSLALEDKINGAAELLKHPNNNLALAYVKRILEKNYPIEPVAVERIGAGFHDRRSVPGEIASASAIRELIASSGRKAAYALMPEESARILEDAISGGHAVCDSGRLWRAVRIALLRASPDELSDMAEMREGFENRMRDRAYEADSFDSFVDLCASKRYPKGRVRRYCLHLLLNLRRGDCRNFQKNGPAYIRVLGTNETGRKLLARMRKSAALPVLSRSGGHVSRYAGEIMRFEHTAAEIWETLTDSPRHKAEARLTSVVLR